jgi:hypothetical protein
MLKITKTLLATGLLASSSYALAVGETFTVDPTIIGTTVNASTTAASFQANKIIGSYSEAIKINTDGTFSAVIIANFNEYTLTQGNTVTFIDEDISGLTENYNLYATIVVDGDLVFNTSGDAVGFANFDGDMNLFIDQQEDTDARNVTFSVGTTDPIDFTLAGDSSNDAEIGFSTSIGGSANVGTSSSFFLSSATFELNSLGQNYFVNPNPFYMEFLSTGNLSDLLAIINAGQAGTDGLFRFGSTVEIDFRVPEPSALAFLGLGLIGAGFMSRRRKS